MTTRQEKRIRRKQLIGQLQRLEIQHQRVSGPDFIISQCGGCAICTKIREIGEQLVPLKVMNGIVSSKNENPIRKYPYTTLIGRMAEEEYWQYKADFISDKEICKLKEVSIKAMSNWKSHHNIKYQMSMKGVTK